MLTYNYEEKSSFILNYFLSIIMKTAQKLFLTHTYENIIKKSILLLLDMPQKTIYIRHTLELMWGNS